MVNEPLSLTTTTSFIVVCVVCFFTVVQRRKVQVWVLTSIGFHYKQQISFLLLFFLIWIIVLIWLPFLICFGLFLNLDYIVKYMVRSLVVESIV